MDNGLTRKKMPMLNYGVLVMTGTHMLTHVFTHIHLALFPVIRTEFNLSLQQLGVIAAIPFLCQALFYIPTGLLSDRFGSKKMILVSSSVAALGSLAASQALNPTMMTFAVSIVYINTTIYHPASYSFITRLLKPRDRPKALGIHGAGGTFGIAIGPISVAILMGIFVLSWRQVYLFWFFPTLLGIIAVLRIRFEPTEDERNHAPDVQSPPQNNSLFTLSLVAFLIFLAARMMAGQMIDAFLPVYLVDEKEFSKTLSSLVYGSSTLMGLVSAPVGGLLATKFGEKKWLFTALSIAGVFFGLAIAIPNVFAFVTLYLAYGFCSFLGMAANSAITAQLSPSHMRGLAYAFFFLPGSVMAAAAPLMASYIADAFGLTIVFLIALCIYAFGLTVLKLGVNI